MYNIIIIDDQIMLRDMIQNTINNQEDLNVIAVEQDAKFALDLAKKFNPDLMLMDVCTLNNSDGIYYAGIVKKYNPNIKIIIMTGVLDINFIEKAKFNKLDSFIYKNISSDSLISTIKNTLDGYSMYPDTNTNKNLKNNILSKLSAKELEVLTLYCKLLDREEVANNLNISSRTLKTHISSIYQKTGFDNLSKLAIYCVSNGYIVPNLENE